MNNRCIIIHYHFFKNAGTSIESILRKNLNDRFLTHELGGPTNTFPASALLPLLDERKDIEAISSHTIHFPVPEHPGISIFPIVFLRHPLDRILSMFNYEQRQDSPSAETTPAVERSIVDYVQERRVNPYSFTLRNYQMWMLARGRAPSKDKQALFEVAKQQIESIPVVGVVENFTESVTQLTKWLQPYFSDLDMQPEHENRSPLSNMDIENRVDFFRQEIGNELFDQLESENALDIELHKIAVKRLLDNRSS
jgi:hypothetical protein